MNRLIQVFDPLNGATGFNYDVNGNLLSVTDARNKQTTYTYESMDRLATRVDPLTRSEGYHYDLAGNMTQFTDRKSQGAVSGFILLILFFRQPDIYNYDALNRLTQVLDLLNGNTGFAYDAKGNLLSVTDARSNATVQ